MFEIKKLNDVLAFANKAHSGQKRKYTGEDYIVHPMRVALAGIYAGGHTANRTAVAAALLHDVVEDTSVTFDELRLFLSRVFINHADTAEIMRLVIALTDVYTKDNFIELNRHQRKKEERVRMGDTFDSTLYQIKLADMLDNQHSINKYDPSFAKTFNAEYLSFLELAANHFGKEELESHIDNLLYAYHCVDSMASIYDHKFFGLIEPIISVNLQYM
jgi:(p)ppGpp synthase/HD superfamily hydrolase